MLFTDIVGSTERATELGDRRWREVLTRHHKIVRSALRRFGGREVDTAGDGFFATFGQPASAIECAVVLVNDLRRAGIEIRAGMHMGEVEQIGPKVGGIAVHIGARVASQAGPCEVLVSNVVRELVAGSDIRFADRGVHSLKGVQGEWHLYAVDMQQLADLGAELSAAGVDVPAPRPAVTPFRVGVAALVVAAVVAATLLLVPRGTRSDLEQPAVNTVTRIDATSGKVLRVVRVGTRPTGVAIGAGAVWVINADDSTLSRVPLTGDDAAPPISIGGTPTGITFGQDLVWITTQFGSTNGEPGSVLRFDPGTKRFAASLQLGNGVRGIAFGAGSVWVTNAIRGTLTRLDAGTGATVATIPAGRSPQAVVVSSDVVWVVDSLGSALLRIDPRTNKIAARIPLLARPNSLAVGSGSVWIVSETGNSLTRVDASTNQVFTTVALSGGPTAVAISGTDVWVSEGGGDAIVRIDATTNRVVQRFKIAGSPGSLAADGSSVWFSVHENS